MYLCTRFLKQKDDDKERTRFDDPQAVAEVSRRAEYEGKYYDWEAGEHLLQKGTMVDEIFHPLEHDIRFIKDEQVPLRDGVKILTDVYLLTGK